MDVLRRKLELLEEQHKTWRTQQHEIEKRIQLDYECKLKKLEEDYVTAISEIDSEFCARREAIIRKYSARSICGTKRISAEKKIKPHNDFDSGAYLNTNISVKVTASVTTMPPPKPSCATSGDTFEAGTVLRQNIMPNVSSRKLTGTNDFEAYDRGGETATASNTHPRTGMKQKLDEFQTSNVAIVVQSSNKCDVAPAVVQTNAPDCIISISLDAVDKEDRNKKDLVSGFEMGMKCYREQAGLSDLKQDRFSEKLIFDPGGSEKHGFLRIVNERIAV